MAIDQAHAIGEATSLIVRSLIEEARHPLMYLRRVQGILRLEKRYSKEGLENAAKVLADAGALMPRLNDVEAIIKSNIDSRSAAIIPMRRGPNPYLRGQTSWHNQNEGEKILPQWDQLKQTEQAESSDIMEIASLVGNNELASKLLSVLNLGAVCPENIDILRKLATGYSESWMVGILKNWLLHGYYGPKKLADLPLIVDKFMGMNTLVDWLLDFQMNSITSSNERSEKNSGKVALEEERDDTIKTALEFLQAASIGGDKEKSATFVDHILRHPRVYANLPLARLGAELSATKFQDPS
jgi:hypothetical protein